MKKPKLYYLDKKGKSHKVKIGNLADMKFKVEREYKINGVDIYPILKKLQSIWNREEILSINIAKNYVRVDSFSADSTNFVEIDSDLKWN